MITLSVISKLITDNGQVTHYTNIEGGKWIEPQTEIPALAHVHALRFINGVEWDEINGIRKDRDWLLDGSDKDIR